MAENKLRGRIPDYACDAMDMLAKEGGTPYLVGGAARDIYMGRDPKDYDIASSFMPDDVIGILKKNNIPVVDRLGNNFGVVVGVFDGNPVEIATFRSDTYGSDAHRPESVAFCKDIKDDLARRDFTCNAMAYGMDGSLVDLFHGRNDIERGFLCPVGNAEERYKEDPLRMYRACRLVSQLRFAYSEDRIRPSDVFVKKDFWEDCKAKDLSVERVRQEIEKTLVSVFPENGLRLLMTSGLINAPCAWKDKRGITGYIEPFAPLAHLYGLEQNPAYHSFDAWEHTVHAVGNIPAELSLRYAALFHDAGKGLGGVRFLNKDGQPSDVYHAEKSAEIAEKSLYGLGYAKEFVKKTSWLVANHMDFISLLDANDSQVRRWVRRRAKSFRRKDDLVKGLSSLREMFVADLEASRKNREEVGAVMQKTGYAARFADRQMCLHSSELEISGETVKEIIKGSNVTIKDAYRSLLGKVQEGVLKNEKKALEASLTKYVDRRCAYETEKEGR